VLNQKHDNSRRQLARERRDDVGRDVGNACMFEPYFDVSYIVLRRMGAVYLAEHPQGWRTWVSVLCLGGSDLPSN